MQSRLPMNQLLAFLMSLDDTGKLSVHCDSKDGKVWRREFRYRGHILAWENKLTTTMAKVPWQDRVAGNHAWVDANAYMVWCAHMESIEELDKWLNATRRWTRLKEFLCPNR